MNVTSRVCFSRTTRKINDISYAFPRGHSVPYEYDFLRRWNHTPLGYLFNKLKYLGRDINPFVFNLCSYNILSQKLLERNFNLYNDIDPRYLFWSHRFKVLTEEMNQQYADIYCLQEVDNDKYYNHFQRFFKSKGYTGLYSRRSGDKPDGCAIFVKNRKFQIVDSISFPFIRQQATLLDRDNLAMLVKLQPRQDDLPMMIVGTTHLLFNPNQGEAKLAQAQLLLAEIERFALDRIPYNSGNRRYHPVIMTGDFNSAPNSAIYQLMTGREVNLNNWTAGTISGQFMDACSKRKLPDTVIPYDLGISDYCRYSRTMKNICSDNATNCGSTKCDYNSSESSRYDPHGSGVLQSFINLQSAYNHHLFQKLISTKHGVGLNGHCWDFIFYSVHKDYSESSLKNLATFSLPTYDNGPDLVFPSKRMGSDHVSLYAKFTLLSDKDNLEISQMMKSKNFTK
ncbi:hypothetical protein GJ496_007762 [Pomphorhynchus laevis]|nr:hypothetical protein GJ496_007762 [Pomphorhynchus laevis]